MTFHAAKEVPLFVVVSHSNTIHRGLPSPITSCRGGTRRLIETNRYQGIDTLGPSGPPSGGAGFGFHENGFDGKMPNVFREISHSRYLGIDTSGPSRAVVINAKFHTVETSR
jgi:hypothetical protein